MLMATPQEWTPDQIAKFQKLWDQLMAGDLEARRPAAQVRPRRREAAAAPSRGRRSSIRSTSGSRASSATASACRRTAFVKQQNRATAESAQEVALEEGLAPLMEWKLSFMNRLIRKGWKTSDYVFAGRTSRTSIRWCRRRVQAERDRADDAAGKAADKAAEKATEKAVAIVRAELDSRASIAKAEAQIRELETQLASRQSGPDCGVRGAAQAAAIAAREAEQLSKFDGLLQRGRGAARDDHRRAEADKPETPIPSAEQMAKALADMVEHGVPLNTALTKVGYDFQVAGGEVPMVNAKLVPLAIAAELGNEPAPVEKRAPDPAPVVVPIPEVNLHLTLEQKGGQARTIRLTKANGETVTADVQPGASTVTMITPNGETVTADITEKE
jgi:hypothetical protein